MSASDLQQAFADVVARIDDGPEFLQAVAQPFRRAFRRHPLRGQPQGWQGLESIPWNVDGFFHGPQEDPASFLDYHTGSVYPQNAASQLPVQLLDPQPGEIIIDTCAAPGSKSTQIGLRLGDDGLLVCGDPSQPRRRALAENLQRQGIGCALVTRCRYGCWRKSIRLLRMVCWSMHLVLGMARCQKKRCVVMRDDREK